MRLPTRWLSTASAAVVITAATGLTAFALEGDLIGEEPTAEAPAEEPVAEEPVPEEPVAEEPVAEESVEDTTTEAVEETVEEPAEPKNHGEVVSEFARTTELTGCAKGHAVSAVARGLDPSEAKPCKGDEEDATEAEEATASTETDAESTEEADDEAADDTADLEAEAAPGKGKGKAKKDR